MNHILAIDDDKNFLKSLSNLLTYKNYKIDFYTEPDLAFQEFQNVQYDTVLLDVKMPTHNGLSLLEKFQTQNPYVPVIMISGESHYEDVVNAIKKGAYDFIEKPLNADRLLITIRNAVERKVWFSERKQLLNSIDNSFQMVGEGKSFKKLMSDISVIAETDAKVLIEGESGTGKELVARALHFKGKRSGGPFIKLNCAAIPSDLLESELFGHRKGAFTGATQDHNGKFIQANGGTLFLDEIGDMDLKLQAKVLRALQGEEIERIGESHSRKIDVRIIAATNNNLTELVKNGKFRADLFHRINVVSIKVPNLADRKEDIPILTRYFLQQYSETYNKKITDISSSGITLLLEYNWTGNVRELKNTIEKLVIFADNSIIQSRDVSRALGNLEYDNSEELYSNNKLSLKEARDNFEREYILKELREHHWKIIETANSLEIDRSALFKKMRKFKINKNA